MSGILWFKDCSYKNKSLVGGKCCSLGELYNLSKKMLFSVADGFAITTTLYDNFISYNNLLSIIEDKITTIDTENIRMLETHSKELRDLIINANLSEEHTLEIIVAYKELCNL